jgi:uncharacterized protein YecE (DUF72 family)
MRSGRAYIGTSGWHYQHWKGTFYPETIKNTEQLEYYQRSFTTVEVNNSFYRLPDKNTFKNWKEAVPGDFIFAVKASRFITHMKKLKDPVESTAAFFSHIHVLKEKLGPVLFQLPPSWKINTERFGDFLARLPNGYRYVFEFRNASWYDEQIYELMRTYNCAFCIYELAHHRSPELITADFIYIRLHGPGDKYQGSYSRAALKKLASKIRDWKSAGFDVYVYFDNDQRGYAAFNAMDLKKYCTQP